MTKPRARPVYTAKLALKICCRLLDGTPLKIICRSAGMPSESTVRLWVMDDVGGFAALYARARLVGYHTMADELIEIADDGSNDTYLDDDGNKRTEHDVIARSRLRVDTRKWLLSKALPKIYGDKLTAEVTGRDGGPIETISDARDLARRVAFLLTAGMQGEDESGVGAGTRH